MIKFWRAFHYRQNYKFGYVLSNDKRWITFWLWMYALQVKFRPDNSYTEAS